MTAVNELKTLWQKVKLLLIKSKFMHSGKRGFSHFCSIYFKVIFSRFVLYGKELKADQSKGDKSNKQC